MIWVKRKKRREKRGWNFAIALILIILAQGIVPLAIAKNAHLDGDISVKNPIYISTKYVSLNTYNDFAILSTYLDSDGKEIFDVTNPKKPSYVTTLHAGSVKFFDDIMYITAIDSVDMYNFTDTINFSDTTRFRTPFIYTEEIHVDDDYIYFLNLQSTEDVFDNAYMLSIFDFNVWHIDVVDDKFNSTLISQFNSTSYYFSEGLHAHMGYQRLHIDNDIAYVLLNDKYPSRSSSIEIIDFSNKTNPFIRSEITLPSAAYKIIIKDDIAFISTVEDSIKIYDLSNLDSPTSISSSAISDSMSDIVIQNNIAYCIESKTLRIFDITDPWNIVTLGIYTLEKQGYTYFERLDIHNDKIYIICSSQYSDRYFFIFDCSDLSNPIKLYPTGIKLDSQTEMILVLIGIIGGPILGMILLITTIVLVVRKLKQRKLRKIQDD